MIEDLFKKDFKKLFVFSLILLFVAAVYNFYQICTNAVNIPYWDEWIAYFTNCGLEEKFNFHWIFSFHNEHKIVWTKLLTWIQYNIDGWNVVNQIKFNYFIQLASLIVLYKILRSVDKSFPLLPLFFIPYFSDILFENALWGFQSQFYIMTLFCFLAIYFGYVKENNAKNSILFTLFTICAIYSQSVVAGIGLIVPYVIKERKNLKNTLIVFVPVVLAIGLFFVGKIDHQVSHYYLPYTLTFWKYFSNLLFNGLFNVSINIYAEIVIVISLLSLYGYLLFKKDRFRDNNFQILNALIFLSLIFISAVAVARSEFGYSVSSRHLSVVIFLIPVIATLLNYIKQQKMLLIYLLILFLTFISSFSFYNYKMLSESRTYDIYILSVVKNKKKIIVTSIYNHNMYDMLHRAKDLKMNWIKQIYE